MLNCMPNRDGLLDKPTIDLLENIGKLWQPDTQRPNLSIDKSKLVYSAPIAKANASSGKPEFLIDAIQYGIEYKHWVSDSSKVQTITLDLGAVYDHINVINIVPNHRCKPKPESALEDGNILSLNTYISSDNINFKKVASNTWYPSKKYKTIVFPETTTRFIKLEILDTNGTNAIIAEIDVGSSFKLPIKKIIN